MYVNYAEGFHFSAFIFISNDIPFIRLLVLLLPMVICYCLELCYILASEIMIDDTFVSSLIVTNYN